MDRDGSYLIDILESARKAVFYVQDLSFDQFSNNSETQDAVIRRIEIIGEAAKRISLQTKQKLPEIPWKQMIGMRNFIIHVYDSIDYKVLWDTVKKDLPLLIQKIEKKQLG